jgi:hypothetical protein
LLRKVLHRARNLVPPDRSNQDVVNIMNSRSSLLRRHRPAGPKCRGGASSVLRLAQPVMPSLSGWLGRAAELAMQPVRAVPAGAQTEFVSSIITRLLPSHELARR